MMVDYLKLFADTLNKFAEHEEKMSDLFVIGGGAFLLGGLANFAFTGSFKSVGRGVNFMLHATEKRLKADLLKDLAHHIQRPRPN